MRLDNIKKYVKKFGWKYYLHRLQVLLGVSKEFDRTLAVQDYFMYLSPEKREEELNDWFFQYHGYRMDFKHPVTLNEKIQWLKLYDSTPLKTRLADKYEVRSWVEEKLGPEVLIPIIGIYDCFDQIDFAGFPEQFVLKATHGCGMNLIVKEKAAFDRKAAKREFDYWSRVYYGLDEFQELHYRDIPHRIIAEKYIENLDGDLYDYKVYCFNGKPKYIQVIKGRYADSRMSFYDSDWNFMPFYHAYFGRGDGMDARPAQLEKMLAMSETLSQGFSLVRVDWFLVGTEQIYFGEMTFTPASGIREWEPPEYDRILGEEITLPRKRYVFR